MPHRCISVSNARRCSGREIGKLGTGPEIDKSGVEPFRNFSWLSRELCLGDSARGRTGRSPRIFVLRVMA